MGKSEALDDEDYPGPYASVNNLPRRILVYVAVFISNYMTVTMI